MAPRLYGKYVEETVRIWKGMFTVSHTKNRSKSEEECQMRRKLHELWGTRAIRGNPRTNQVSMRPLTKNIHVIFWRSLLSGYFREAWTPKEKRSLGTPWFMLSSQVSVINRTMSQTERNKQTSIHLQWRDKEKKRCFSVLHFPLRRASGRAGT